jgi:hypothetical protein
MKKYLSGSVLDLSKWCEDAEEAAHEYGQNMEELHQEPNEYNISYIEVIERRVRRLVRQITEWTGDRTIIKMVYVSEEFMLESERMRDVMVMLPNAILGRAPLAYKENPIV